MFANPIHPPIVPLPTVVEEHGGWVSEGSAFEKSVFV